MKTFIVSGKTVMVSDQDFDLSFYAWHLDDHGYVKGSLYRSGRTPKTIRLAIVIARRMGLPEGKFVDHKNGDTLDNQRSNLRPATRSQNAWNRKNSKNNKSGYKGICWRSKRKKWAVTIDLNGQRVYFRMFDDLEEAAKERARLLPLYHGEFANTGAVFRPIE